MMRLKTVLIGLGNIGALYDLGSPKHEKPLTHLKALMQNEDYEIMALVDPDVKKHARIQAETALSHNVFMTHVEPLNVPQIDIAILATPLSQRDTPLKLILNANPKAIVFEKPFCFTSDDGAKIIAQCGNAKTLINFHRRYDSDHQAFREELPKEPPSKIIFNYSKGIWNYGSHGVDLIMNWFGPVKEINSAKMINDLGDPLIDATLKLECGAQVNFIAHDSFYDQFEFEIFYADAKYNLRNGGIHKTKQTVVKNLYHQGYDHLGIEEEIFPSSKVYGLENLYTDLAKTCKNPSLSISGCSAEEAIEGIKIIEMIIERAKK